MTRVVVVGATFGEWLVQAEAPRKKDRRWRCLCSCGRVKDVYQYNLLSGVSRSCGGHKTPWNAGQGVGNAPIGACWRNMMARCTNPAVREYKNYGGRGISVHPEWHDFAVFSAEVGPHPGPGWTLDRTENAGNYQPGNVRWATRAEQARNKRSNRLVTFKGRTQCVQDWALELGVTGNHLYRRVRRGLTLAQALQDVVTNPPQVRGPYSV